jgi:putative SOS response-associated peptidase YedK
MLEVFRLCGRYSASKDPATLAAEFDAVDATDEADTRPDYNVAPTREKITVVERHPRDEEGTPDPDTTVRSLRVMRWGLVPFWAKDKSVGAKMINARSESVGSKPAFKSSLAKRRCLVPADGWYEWRRDGKVKQPFFMTPADGSSIAMAGLWSTWKDKEADAEADPLVSYTILTTDAIGQLTEIHERMPLLLPRESWAAWLNPDLEDVSELLTPTPELVAALELRPVSDAVNSVRNNGPELMARHEPAPSLDEPALFDPASGQ